MKDRDDNVYLNTFTPRPRQPSTDIGVSYHARVIYRHFSYSFSIETTFLILTFLIPTFRSTMTHSPGVSGVYTKVPKRTGEHEDIRWYSSYKSSTTTENGGFTLCVSVGFGFCLDLGSGVLTV